MKCANCGSKMTCSCQQRTASDGKSVCSNCVTAYEASLRPNATKENKPEYIWDIPKHYYPKN
jgi:hypothetical protein